MEWKSDVRVEKSNGLWLCSKDERKEIAEEDEQIVRLMEQGVKDDEELLNKVSELSGFDELLAGFRLAQFVEDYGEFLKEGEKSNVYE